MAGTRIQRARKAARFAAAAAVAFLVAKPASAFYFRGWPGDGIPRDRNLVAPRDRLTDTVPGRIEPRDDHDHDHDHEVDHQEKPPSTRAPEPGTLVLAAIGVGVVGLVRRKRR